MQTFNLLNAFIYSQKPSGLDCLGGDSRDRTGDLLLARQALSQLSYIPISYLHLLFRKVWWARVGSNHRPYDYQSYALAS